MTIPTWPTTLPRPERNTWSAKPQDSRQRRRSEAGPPGWRGRFSNAAKLVSLSVVLDRNQNAVLENFFARDTAKGSLPFWMPDPTTHGWPLLTSSGAPLLVAGGVNHGKPILLAARWLCSFGEQLPDETIVGVQFRRSFSVVVYP